LGGGGWVFGGGGGGCSGRGVNLTTHLDLVRLSLQQK